MEQKYIIEKREKKKNDIRHNIINTNTGYIIME